MRNDSRLVGYACSLAIAVSSCAGTGRGFVNTNDTPPTPTTSSITNVAEVPEARLAAPFGVLSRPVFTQIAKKTEPSSESQLVKQDSPEPEIQSVSHQQKTATSSASSQDATLTINETDRLQFFEEAEQPIVQSANDEASYVPPPAPNEFFEKQSDPNTVQLNLPTALSMIGGQHPAVGFAQWRVQEAYAQFDRANVLWLPSLQAGLSFHRHDGNYQASNGDIVDVNRNSFQYGLGAGATGAGTTPRPGLVAQFHLADAIFQPEIAEKTAWARGHAANGVINDQLLSVAVGYLELLGAEQDLRIVEESYSRTSDLTKLTQDFAEAGQGLQADADRLQTELTLVEDRQVSARERVEVASARLSQALSIPSGQRIVPLDPTVVPIELVSLNMDQGSLITTGLSTRPELKQAQALVSAACEQYKRQQYAPFVPSVLLGLSTGEFGGGTGNNLGNLGDRYDFDAMVTWEIRNLGLGESAVRRESAAVVQQARFESLRMMDQVAREVSEAHTQVKHRANRIAITQRAIQSAEDSYDRNLNRIREGQGLPIEVLQSVQALENARRAYLQAVVDYNESQFRLQWALGWPVTAKE